MLVFKDLNGDAGLAEHGKLAGALQVGNQFMTVRDEVSDVLRTGEFVTMRRRTPGQKVRLCAFFESPDARALNPVDLSTTVLGDDQDRAGGYTPFKRSRQYDAIDDEETGDSQIEGVGGFKQRFRLPRFTRVEERIYDVDHTTQLGRQRVWHLGDGETVLMTREQFDPADPRYFMGVNRSGVTARRTRVSKVELVEVKADTGKPGKVLLDFETFSGLGFDPGRRGISLLDAPGALLYDDNFVYPARAGRLWGRFTYAGVRMDPSASYAVAEPAWHPGGFLSLVAVHGRAIDALDPQASVLKQLTCTYTTKTGKASTTIALPEHGESRYIWSVVETDLLRVSPTALVLRVRMCEVMSPTAAGGGSAPLGTLAAIYWSADAGQNWDLLDLSGMATFPDQLHLERSLVADGKGGALLITSNAGLLQDREEAMIAVHRLSPTGIELAGTISGATFSDGLYASFEANGVLFTQKYWPVAAGGGVRVKVGNDIKQALWIQFDPACTWPRKDRNGNTDPNMITYPGARPMLMLSVDNGATWERRFLPTIWPQHVGFVVSADESTLLLPVITPRAPAGGYIKAAQVRIHRSTDGGKTWKRTNDKFNLPAETFVDGQQDVNSDTFRIADWRYDYNRGELFQLLPLLDGQGRALRTNPGRPWIADSRVKAPS